MAETADEGLTAEQRQLVNNAAAGALVELLTEHPEVAKLPSGVIGTVFLAGVTAGVEALNGVLRDSMTRWPGA